MTHIAYSHEPEHTRNNVVKTINSKALWIVAIVAISIIWFLVYPRGTEPEETNPNPTPTVNTVVDIDGNIYKTVKIGNQVWMTENLKTTRLNDGQSILYEPDSTDWANLRTPGYCWPNNDPSNKDDDGALYNWYAVDTGKLAPIGWHVPTDDEWKILADYLGGESVAGGKLKEIGFSVCWAGERTYEGNFIFFNEVEKYWTVTEVGWHSTDVWYHTITKLES